MTAILALTPTDIIGPHSPVGIVLTIAFALWVVGYLLRSGKEEWP